MNIKINLDPEIEILRKRGLEDGGKVQKFIDNEVLRCSDPYVPFLSGDLKKSGILGTKLGTGVVTYNAIYARENYYFNAGTGKEGISYGGIRGKKWFERMKVNHLKDILDGAKKIAGGK